ncbi:MAG: NADH-quinone oxidoreductase subunit K [Armatimonadota bacterium]|nr:MAG: NADH-quinone oxidoreductase subunit K [Armatimonadota bacterium]
MSLANLPLHFFILLSTVLLTIGLYGLISRRNAIAVLMSIEIVMNAANLNFAAFWRYLHPQSLEGVVFVLVTITVAAAEVAVGMAVVLSIYRTLHTVNVDEVAQMRG